MAHKKALAHRKCGARLPDGSKCSVTWGDHPRDADGKVAHA